MAMTMEELVNLIAYRDHISKEEARYCIEDCLTELTYIITNDGTYDEAAEAIEYGLGLEPDYLDMLLEWIM